ncbi:MAG TPA: hypothetical protein VIO59_01125 [Rhodanobacter sp.]
MNRRGTKWQPLLLQGNPQQGERGFIIRLAIEQVTTRLFGLPGMSTVQQLHDVFDVGLLRGQAVMPLNMKTKKPRGLHRAVDYSDLGVLDQNVTVTRPQK